MTFAISATSARSAPVIPAAAQKAGSEISQNMNYTAKFVPASAPPAGIRDAFLNNFICFAYYIVSSTRKSSPRFYAKQNMQTQKLLLSPPCMNINSLFAIPLSFSYNPRALSVLITLAAVFVLLTVFPGFNLMLSDYIFSQKTLLLQLVFMLPRQKNM